MRLLKRGTRGEDVLLWQTFLMQLRKKPENGFYPGLIRLDGIFGGQTKRATVAFQERYQLRSDGAVGGETFKKSRSLGFLNPPTKLDPLGPLLGPYAERLRLEPPPGIAEARGAPPAAPTKGNDRNASFSRLRSEGWQASSAIRAGLNGGNAVLQLLRNGSGDYIYDEYSIVVTTLPARLTPEAFLQELATDLNRCLNDTGFDAVNTFTRRTSGKPKVGEIIDIDIAGPDNGSVILVDFQPQYFILQTVDSDRMGAHPENGGREFGFERVASGVRFYTRGVSRPGNYIVRLAGAYPQRVGWTRLVTALGERLIERGGKANPGSVTTYKRESPQ